MIDREWHILEKPEYWDEGPCFDNKGNLPEKEGFCHIVLENQAKKKPKIICNDYFIDAPGRGHFWDPDTNICGISEYAVTAWMELIPFPEVPDGKTASA